MLVKTAPQFKWAKSHIIRCKDQTPDTKVFVEEREIDLVFIC